MLAASAVQSTVVLITRNSSGEGPHMATTITAPLTTCLPTHWSLADIQAHVGGIPFKRIRSFPPPGLATVEDAETLNFPERGDLRTDRRHPGGEGNGLLRIRDCAMLIITRLNKFVDPASIGNVLAAAGDTSDSARSGPHSRCVLHQLVQFPDGRLPREPVPELVPDLAIEVLSESNAPGEMERKRQDYFQAGVRLVWYIDPRTRSATIYTSAEDPGTRHAETEPLTGGDVLPGFTLSLAEIFRQADRQSGV